MAALAKVLGAVVIASFAMPAPASVVISSSAPPLHSISTVASGEKAIKDPTTYLGTPFGDPWTVAELRSSGSLLPAITELVFYSGAWSGSVQVGYPFPLLSALDVGISEALTPSARITGLRFTRELSARERHSIRMRPTVAIRASRVITTRHPLRSISNDPMAPARLRSPSVATAPSLVEKLPVDAPSYLQPPEAPFRADPVWLPRSGTVRGVDTADGRRNITSSFQWASQSDIDSFSDRVWENDMKVTTNGDVPGDVFPECGDQTPYAWMLRREPIVIVTDLPDETYMDNRVLNSCSVVDFTIGTFGVEHLVPNRTYQTSVTGPRGDASTNVFEMSASNLQNDCPPFFDDSSCVGLLMGTGQSQLLVKLAGNGDVPSIFPSCRSWYKFYARSFPCIPESAARILTVGDSITAARTGDFSWRYRAAVALTNSAPNFVGDYSSPYGGGAYAVAGWDTNHQAVWGRAVFDEKYTIAGAVGLHQPDVLVIHMGTNDIGPVWNKSVDQAVSDMATLIDNARAAKSDVQIVLVLVADQIATASSKTQAYANGLAQLAITKTNARSLIITADGRAGFDPALDDYDGTHPNARGEYKIARAVVDALWAGFHYGRYFGPIPAFPATGIPQAVAVSTNASTTSGGTATIVWQAVANARSYKVYARDETAGQTAYTLQQFDVVARTWTQIYLTYGHRYRYYVTTLATNGIESAASASVLTVAGQPPAPASLAAVRVSAGKISLSWPALTGWTNYNYRVWRRDVTAGQSAFTAISYGSTATTKVDYPLTPGHTYEYYVDTFSTISGQTSPRSPLARRAA